LDDVSTEGRARRTALAHQLSEQLTALEVSRMTRAHQVDFALLKNELEYEIWDVEQLKEWRWNPLLYTDIAGNSVYTLMARDFAPLPTRLHDAGARLSQLPRLLVQVREALDPKLVPRIHAETAVKQNPGVLSLIDGLIVPRLQTLPETQQTELKAIIA